jgi:hypothetical protein
VLGHDVKDFIHGVEFSAAEDKGVGIVAWSSLNREISR